MQWSLLIPCIELPPLRERKLLHPRQPYEWYHVINVVGSQWRRVVHASDKQPYPLLWSPGNLGALSSDITEDHIQAVCHAAQIHTNI